MKKMLLSYKRIIIPVFSFLMLLTVFSFITFNVVASSGLAQAGPPVVPADADVKVSEGALGFKIPTLGVILTFTVRAFFVLAGLAALFYMLLGAFAWITSGGDADAVKAAQQKIQAAIIGVLVIVGVLAIVWTLENVVFGGKVCFGLSCPVTLPTLL